MSTVAHTPGTGLHRHGDIGKKDSLGSGFATLCEDRLHRGVRLKTSASAYSCRTVNIAREVSGQKERAPIEGAPSKALPTPKPDDRPQWVRSLERSGVSNDGVNDSRSLRRGSTAPRNPRRVTPALQQPPSGEPTVRRWPRPALGRTPYCHRQDQKGGPTTPNHGGLSQQKKVRRRSAHCREWLPGNQRTAAA